jgi:hypothetical protein
VTDPRDIEQPEPRRVDSRGLPLAERPRFDARVVPGRPPFLGKGRTLISSTPACDADIPEAREAEPTAPLTLADALEVELSDGWHDARDIPRLPRSERRG